MNTEVMELYKAKGVNPASGCVPMLLTLPFLIAFYSMLQMAIEIRGANFVGWITNLSAPDPYFILPVAMGAVQFWQTKLQPMGGDPTQQRIMMFMPPCSRRCRSRSRAAWCSTGCARCLRSSSSISRTICSRPARPAVK